MDPFDDLDAQTLEQRHNDLRSQTGVAARRARYEARARQRPSKDHCPEGHAYTPENTYYYSGSRRRMCLTCHAARRTHTHLSSHGTPTYKGRPVIDLRPYLRDE